MKVTFLGTGTSQGVPIIACPCRVCQSTDARDNRLRSSVMISAGGLNIVVDTGPDFRQQMLRAQVKRLDGVVFTHAHKDHIAGFDDIRAFNYMQKEKMDVYADQIVQKQMHREFYYIFEEQNRYPGVPEVNLHTIDLKPFLLKGVEFIPIQVMHHRLPVLGFRVGDFTYITDANYIDEAEKEKIKGSKVLVLNALRRESHISHYTLDQAVALVTELNVQQTYLTHISHQMGLHSETEHELPPHIRLAYDGLEISL
jgi:phosphoribosyl 1,2-cyclic phosphate phosphodiesterase